MKQIIPRLHTFTGLFVGRVYLIEDKDGLTIIDASIESAPDKIVRQLKAAGHQPSDVKRILITHGHPDHIGGLPKLKQLTGAEVITSAIERPLVEGTTPIPRVPEEKVSGLARLMRPKETIMPGTPVDRVVGEGDTLPEVMGGLEVLATPGHSDGHLTFWQPERQIAFCGDVIMRMFGFTLPFAAFTVDMEENKRSIRRVAELDAGVICFGHGKPLMKQTAQTIRAFARKVGAMP
ncbi:MAG: MBL fold metallo-hydrolase [Ardenticatenaceae bacterium]